MAGATDKNVRPVGELLQEELADQQLDAEQLESLLRMQQAVLGDKASERDNAARKVAPVLVAACLLVTLLGLFSWYVVGPGKADYTEQIALEVIENHLKLKPLDVSASSIKEARGFFTQLDFSPVTSSLLNTRFGLPQSAMLGGRYCSIKGVTAAQFRYRQGPGALSTLYEVPYRREVFGEIPDIDAGGEPLEWLLKGLQVTMWVEKGLLMVLVRGA